MSSRQKHGFKVGDPVTINGVDDSPKGRVQGFGRPHQPGDIHVKAVVRFDPATGIGDETGLFFTSTQFISRVTGGNA